MLAGAGGVRLPFVGVGEAAAVGEVVAGCGMEREPSLSSGQRRRCKSRHWWSSGGGQDLSSLAQW